MSSDQRNPSRPLACQRRMSVGLGALTRAYMTLKPGRVEVGLSSTCPRRSRAVQACACPRLRWSESQVANALALEEGKRPAG